MQMTQDQARAMKFERPGMIPARVGVLPAAWAKHREQLSAIAAQYPEFLPARKTDYDQIGSWAKTYAAGDHVDAWGCVWRNVYHGHEAMVKVHPVPRREDVWKLQMPKEDTGLPHGFMYLRLADLRGFEELMVDFAEEPPELQRLIDVVLGYNLRQVDGAISKAQRGDLLGFGDDLGIQRSLPISPTQWRKYLKPCFAAIYGRCRAAGLWVFMHTDGHIYEIIPDLVDCGVNVVNPQIRANGLDNLVRVCKGKVCVDLDLDRQLFPFASPDELDRHVRECVEALGSPEGGLCLTAEIDDGVPLENIQAICEALRKYRRMFSSP
jgi:uroporphyrinogen decarboxylase